MTQRPLGQRERGSRCLNGYERAALRIPDFVETFNRFPFTGDENE
jgi:hypothetical protein